MAFLATFLVSSLAVRFNGSSTSAVVPFVTAESLIIDFTGGPAVEGFEVASRSYSIDALATGFRQKAMETSDKKAHERRKSEESSTLM